MPNDAWIYKGNLNFFLERRCLASAIAYFFLLGSLICSIESKFCILVIHDSNYSGRRCSCPIYDVRSHWLSTRNTTGGKCFISKLFIFSYLYNGEFVIPHYVHSPKIHAFSLSVLTCRRCDICSRGGAHVVRCHAMLISMQPLF